jgi:hypothetical protein
VSNRPKWVALILQKRSTRATQAHMLCLSFCWTPAGGSSMMRLASAASPTDSMANIYPPSGSIGGWGDCVMHCHSMQGCQAASGHAAQDRPGVQVPQLHHKHLQNALPGVTLRHQGQQGTVMLCTQLLSWHSWVAAACIAGVYSMGQAVERPLHK